MLLRTRWMLCASALAWSCGAIGQTGNLVAAYAPSIPATDSDLSQAEWSARKDPQTATLLLMLADRYQALSRHADAERLYRRSIAMFEQTMGPQHPNVGTASHRLAQLYLAQGAYASAERHHRRALSVFERSLGAEHANVTALRVELAGSYHLQGRLTEAQREYMRAIAFLKQGRETDDNLLEIAQKGLAAVHRAQGGTGEAEVAAAPVAVRNLSTRYGPVVLRQRAR